MPRKPLPGSLEVYLREIGRTPLLSAAEERGLAGRIRGDDAADALAARDHLVLANLRLVVRIARNHLRRGLDLADLIAEGNLGLFVAAERYDPDRGTRFSTFASYWIWQAIGEALRNTTKAIKVPCYLQDVLSKWLAAGRPQDDRLLAMMPKSWQAQRRGGPTRRARSARRVAANVNAALAALHVDSFSGDAAGNAPGEPADPHPDPLDPHGLPADESDLALGLHQLAREDARLAQVLRLRHGLDDGQSKGMTLREIGAVLGVTRERVRQIEADALDRLRDLMGVGVPPELRSYTKRRREHKAEGRRATRAKAKAGANCAFHPKSEL